MSEYSQFSQGTVRDVEVITAPENQPVSLLKLLKDLGFEPAQKADQKQDQPARQKQDQKQGQEEKTEKRLNETHETIASLEKELHELRAQVEHQKQQAGHRK